MRAALWLAVAALAHCISLALPCPSACVCKWKGGKQTVECPSKGLIGIPEGLDPGTQVLDFSGNDVKILTKERFQKLGLVNLQRIFLARCGVSEIVDRAFLGLTNLVELDLSHNRITAIPTAAFKDFPSLMRLSLNANPIKRLGAHAFQPLFYLTSLEMSGCELETVEVEAFSGLDSLEWLKLDGNRLAGIRGAQVLPKGLHGVDLHNNPWQCDCRMLDLHAWLLGYKNPLAVEPTCKGPARLRGVSLKALDAGDLACMPEVSPTTLYLEIAEGKNVSLLCRVNAVPEARISWWFQGNILQNDTMVAPGVRLLYYVEEGREDKRSELFIFHTNSEDNGTFACVAENQAGKMQSNYTIRIIVKEEPTAEMSGFPMEYVVALAGGLVLVGVVVCVSVAVCILSCRRQRRRRRKQESGKAVALQGGTTGKAPPKDTERLTAATGGSKMNGTVFISDRSKHELASYADRARTDTDPGLGDTYRNYSLEQNPDLINDAESVGKERRLKGADDNTSYQESIDPSGDPRVDMGPPPQPQPAWQDARYAVAMPVVDMYHQPLSADVHLSAGRFLDGDGYPLDYGLPKMPAMAMPHPAPNLYRTLPHKPRLHTTTARRYSRDAEFMRPAHGTYDPFQPPDVRYTVDGYPATAAPMPVSPGASLDPALPSPPSAYKSDPPLPSPLPCAAPCGVVGPCSAHCGVGPCAPAPKRCSVGAQTSEDPVQPVLATSAVCAQPSLTESPDEGYEGEGADAGEI